MIDLEKEDLSSAKITAWDKFYGKILESVLKDEKNIEFSLDLEKEFPILESQNVYVNPKPLTNLNLKINNEELKVQNRKLTSYISQKSVDILNDLPYFVTQYAILFHFYSLQANIKPSIINWNIEKPKIAKKDIDTIKLILERITYLDFYANMLQNSSIYERINEYGNIVEGIEHYSSLLHSHNNNHLEECKKQLLIYQKKLLIVNHLYERQDPKLIINYDNITVSNYTSLPN